MLFYLTYIAKYHNIIKYTKLQTSKKLRTNGAYSRRVKSITYMNVPT